MRVCFHRPQIIDRNHRDICASRFYDGAQNIAANPTKPVDGYFDDHVISPEPWGLSPQA
jgi:hypothetical protein